MIEEIKRKRGRPPKLKIGDTVTVNNKGEVSKVKKSDPSRIGTVDHLPVAENVAVKLKTDSDVKVKYNPDYKSKNHIIDEIIDYIQKYAGPMEKSHIEVQARSRKWSQRYYIYKNLVTFFGIDDKTFDEKSLK